MIVVDASVLAPALGDDGSTGETARARLHGNSLTAPELVDLETASVLRGLVLARKLSRGRADAALDSLAKLPIRRVAHRVLLPRCWQLRDNITIYDASYVALAELHGVPLVTADARLAAAPGITCPVEVLT